MRLLLIFCVSGLTSILVSAQEGLTASQIEAVKAQLEVLRKQNREGVASKNSNAAVVFRNASQSPKAALELYLSCKKEVDFKRLGKKDSDYREWAETMNDVHDFDPFLTTLQLQLEYLSLTTRSAYSEDISTIFPDLTRFLGKLASLDVPPHPDLNKDVNGSVFADFYRIDEQVKRGTNAWEPNPMNIGAIYNKTILPYLREANPQSLDSAWQNRIATEGNMAKLYYDFEDKMERFVDRMEGQIKGGNGNRIRREMIDFVKRQAIEGAQFSSKQLPKLQWGQLVDRYNYSNQALAAKSMLGHIQSNIAHEDAMNWASDLESMIETPKDPAAL